MGKVQLDQSRMLGFKITQSVQSKSAASAQNPSPKIGSKIGSKPGSRLGAKIGAKV